MPVREAWILAGLVVAAVALRVPGLGPPSLWFDDAWVALVDRVDGIDQILRIGVTAPGFSLALKGIFQTFGFSEVSAQSFPFIAGVAGVPLLYVVGRRAGLRIPSATAMAALVAFAPFHITYSTRVKHFTVDFVLVTVLLWLALVVIDRPDRRRKVWLLLGAVATTLFSAATISAVAAIVSAAAIPDIREKRWRELLFPLAYAVFAGGLAAAFRASVVSDDLVQYWAQGTSDGPTDAVVAIVRFLAYWTGGLAGPRTAATVVIVFAILAAGLIRAPLEKVALLWGPLTVAVVASFLDVPLGAGRTDLYLYPPTVLALGYSVQRLLGERRPWVLSAAAFAVAAIVVLPVRPATYHVHDTSPLIDELATIVGPGDRIVVGTPQYYPLWLYGPWPVTVRPDRRSQTGWTVESELTVHAVPWVADAHAIVDAVPSDLGEGSVHVLLSPEVPGQYAFVREELLTRGYQRVALRRYQGSVLATYRHG
jgi:hypothetical protein